MYVTLLLLVLLVLFIVYITASDPIQEHYNSIGNLLMVKGPITSPKTYSVSWGGDTRIQFILSLSREQKRGTKVLKTGDGYDSGFSLELNPFKVRKSFLNKNGSVNEETVESSKFMKFSQDHFIDVHLKDRETVIIIDDHKTVIPSSIPLGSHRWSSILEIGDEIEGDWAIHNLFID